MTRRWWLPAALSLALVAGCGAGEPSPSGSPGGSTTGSTAATVSPSGSPSAAPRRLTPEDDGATFSMVVGRSVSLVVSDTSADDPEVTGDAVQLVQVVNVTASGVREWEVRAEKPGTSTITSRSPEYRITVVVG
ncbi:hypothetical protein [Oryzobacter telluris]|uniref:hypothetical protein n=1 Tax=Oryzobacter telluris TaxID=3149179 RepID=UPI00370D3F47